MKSLKAVFAENNLTTSADAKAWLQSKSFRLISIVEERFITERTLVSSKLLGWTRGNAVLEGLETLAQTIPSVARLLRLIKESGGVDISDDPSVLDTLSVALNGVGVTLTDDEKNKLRHYGSIELFNYQLYAPNGRMPSDTEINAALR